MIMWKIYLCITFTVLMGVDSAPRINSTWGLMDGVDRNSSFGVLYYGYLGIRYALPPTGDRRFAMPQPDPGVSGVFDASKYGPICIQISLLGAHTPGMSEDCLTLNVFVPSFVPMKNIPVMVWIHGGGFVIGDAIQYEPGLLVTKGKAIVVTVQYRLGLFGFIATGSDAIPGNLGLWDQHLALMWVKSNIAAFGGDADNITIIGESAGGSSVAYHLLYPGSNGLFQKGILQSAAAASLLSGTADVKQFTISIAKMMGCVKDVKHKQTEILKCLRTKSSTDLLKASLKNGTFASNMVSSSWGAVIDGKFIVDDTPILLRNQSFLASTPFYECDVMVGVNNNEGGWIYLSALRYDYRYNTSQASTLFHKDIYDKIIIPAVSDAALGPHDPKINDVIRVFYTYPRHTSGNLIPQKVMDTFADSVFIIPSLHIAKAHAQGSTRNNFFYHFNRFPSFTGSNPIKGMVHGQDCLYLFDLSPTTVRYFLNTGNISQADYDLSTTFIEFLAEFARTGDPNSIIEPKLGEPWPNFDVNHGSYLSFTVNMSVSSDLYPKRASLWNQVILNLMDVWDDQVSTATDTSKPCVPTGGTGTLLSTVFVILTIPAVVVVLYI